VPRKSADAIAGEYWRQMNAPPPPPPPEPPDYLSPRAKEIWRSITASRPPEYFDAPNGHLLAGFCVSAAISDAVYAELNGIDPTDPKQRRRWNTLQIMAARQSKLMLTLATRLRLLPTKYMAEKAVQEPAPWGGSVR
jgi:phage terminase small subunit